MINPKLFWRTLFVVLSLLGLYWYYSAAANYPESPQYNDGKFTNHGANQDFGLMTGLTIAKRFFFDKPPGTVPQDSIPVIPMTDKSIIDAPNNTLYRLGHSTILLKIAHRFVLIDPMFAERASPFRLIGPKRFHQPPITINNIPNIAAIVISHDHYDHLDQKTILRLASRTNHFVTPLGVGDLLIDWGVKAEKVIQLDWWQEIDLSHFTFTATPAQHFSGRGLLSRNSTLWASWVIRTPERTIFFSGDSGYSQDFKRIGEKFGPFDLSIMEAGAYNEQWPSVHFTPEETIQAHCDLNGRVLLPVHNSTFDLAFHSWQDPLNRIKALAIENEIPLATPRIGEPMPIGELSETLSWWETLK